MCLVYSGEMGPKTSGRPANKEPRVKPSGMANSEGGPPSLQTNNLIITYFDRKIGKFGEIDSADMRAEKFPLASMGG